MGAVGIEWLTIGSPLHCRSRRQCTRSKGGSGAAEEDGVKDRIILEDEGRCLLGIAKAEARCWDHELKVSSNGTKAMIRQADGAEEKLRRCGENEAKEELLVVNALGGFAISTAAAQTLQTSFADATVASRQAEELSTFSTSFRGAFLDLVLAVRAVLARPPALKAQAGAQTCLTR